MIEYIPMRTTYRYFDKALKKVKFETRKEQCSFKNLDGIINFTQS